ncbi:MAG: Calcium-transporting ATPase, partial [Planctomycetota bacterium]
QFSELVIWILIIAAILSGWMGEWADTAAILAIVLVNGILGFLQEEKAGRALAALQKMSSPTAKVIRDGALQLIPSREIVPGDRLELEAGDHVPSDARLLDSYSLRIQEAALTGESVPVDKDAGASLETATPLADRRNMVYMGTVVATGKAGAVVVATGMSTELGQIAGLLQQTVPEPTPLQRRLAELGRILVAVCLLIVALIFVMEMLRGGHWLEVLLISVSLAVAAVPEGLPAVVTMALALGLQRMVQRNALVRRLPSVETLGSVTVVCSDKTGTLTRNEMTVREIVTNEGTFHVTGAGYAPHGEFQLQASASSPPMRQTINAANHIELQQLLLIGARCNHAAVRPVGDSSDAWRVIGDPTEGALLVAAKKGGVRVDPPHDHLVFEIPFDSERKTMSVVVRRDDQSHWTYSKGAPEVLLAKCTHELQQGIVVNLTQDRREQIIRTNAEMASRALRVLALAYRQHDPHEKAVYEESDLIFVGLVGMIDPPRDEVRDAVAKCHTAGIRPVMITGDHPATALAIAQELRLAKDRTRVLTGADLDQLSDSALIDSVADISVYARVSAEHKLRIVSAWKQRGEIVAMTGDGVNDAPAVKAADIGIAMGITGTDVTKEASDMVLTDDNFASIVSAVEEGRGIFDNIQKFIHYLLSCNAGEVLLMFFAAIVGWPVPLQAIQILWINLVTDGLPALALAMEPPERDIMTRPPRPPHESVITRERGWRMLLHGSLIAAVAAAGFWIAYQGDQTQLPRARTIAFCVTAFSQLFFAFSCRSQRYTLPELGLFTNPHLFVAICISGLLQLSVAILPFAQRVFETGSELRGEWLLILGLSLAPVTLIEIGKLIRAARRPGRTS